MMRFRLRGALGVVIGAMGLAGGAAASPFDKAAGLAAYGTGWGGDYDAVGVGGRARLEYEETIGLDLFAEAFEVDAPSTERHDVVIGFDLYVPFSPLDFVRLRPMFGFCADFSFLEPHHDRAPRSDDIAFGVHAGAGVEVGLGNDWSIFGDVQQVAWFGHDRYASQWTGSLDGDIEFSTLTQGRIGVQLHLF